MANKFPLILNTSANQIQEIASGDNLDLTGCKIVGLQGINSAGIVTFTKAHVGAATTWGEDLVVTGNARVTGILTVGTNSVTISGNDVNITGVTTSANFKTGTSNLHNVGLEIAGINVLGADTPIGTGATIYNSGAAVFTGIVTATNYVGTINTPAQPNITSVGTLSSLNVSGSVSVGGTLTYEDVTNIDSVGIVTAREGIFIPDNKKLHIGNTAGTGDLQIYHNATDSRIHSLTNTLSVRSNLFDIRRYTDAQYFVNCTSSGAVEIYKSNNKKLETTNTGITVTGTVAATAYTGDGSALTGIEVGLSTEALTTAGATVTLDLTKDDHKITKSGTYTVTCTGGSEGSSHSLRIENSGTSSVSFSSYFKFPSGGTPSLPTTNGAISLISFTVHKAGSVGVNTVLLSGASVNFS